MANAWKRATPGQLACADIRTKYRWGFGADFQIQGVVVKVFANGAVMLDGCKDERDPFGIKTRTTGYFVVSVRNYVLSIIDVGGALGSLEAWEE